MRLTGLALALGAALFHSPVVLAACPDAATVDTFIADRGAARPATPPIGAGSSLEDGLCAQAMIIERLSKDLGPVIGYKAGLTSPPAQQAFGVDEPVFGTLLRDMLLPSGSSLRAADAVRSLFEADLIVEIGESAVNEATTPAEVLASIRGVRPFLELPALVAPLDIQLDGPMITSINVGAWRGVMGDLIALPADETGVAMLADFTARLSDETTGETISAAPGKAVLGHPLNAVIWIAGVLKAQGKALKPGDLISVGSIGPLNPMKPGQSVRLTYEGLPGTPSVTASFE